MKKIIIGICTYKRPLMLKHALNAVSKLVLPDMNQYLIEVIIVDNDEQATARDSVNQFAKATKYAVHYCIEPQKGLSSVRNRLLKECYRLNADLLAGCDDDDLVDKEWLVTLLDYFYANQAILVSGPLFNIKGIQNRWFKEGSIIHVFSSYSMLVDLWFLKSHKISFDEAYNELGLEDTDFCHQINEKKGKIVWTNKAIVRQQYHESRDRPCYQIQRKFANAVTRVYIEMNRSEYSKSRLFIISLVRTCLYTISLPIWFLLKHSFKNHSKQLFKSFFMIFVVCGFRIKFYANQDGH